MLERIKEQADVINIVNKFTPGNNSLTGLSLGAIANWADRNAELGVTDVQGELEDISKKIGCLHDRSNPPKENGTDGELLTNKERIRELLASKMIRQTS